MRALTPEEYTRLSRDSAQRRPCHPGCVDIPKDGEEGDEDYFAFESLVERGYYAWRDCPMDDTRIHGERTLLGDEACRIYRMTKGF